MKHKGNTSWHIYDHLIYNSKHIRNQRKKRQGVTAIYRDSIQQIKQSAEKNDLTQQEKLFVNSLSDQG